MTTIDKRCYELELNHKKKKVFLLIYLDPLEIWVDTQGLPNTSFLCAMIDGASMLKSKVGDKKNMERVFVNIEWAINDWGGLEQIVSALKKRKQMIIDDLPNIRKKMQSCTKEE